MYAFNIGGICGGGVAKFDWEIISAELMRRYGETGTTPAQIKRELWPDLAMSTIHSRLRHLADLGLSVPRRPKSLRAGRYGRCACGEPYIKARDGAIYCPECAGTPPPVEPAKRTGDAVTRWYPVGVRGGH